MNISYFLRNKHQRTDTEDNFDYDENGKVIKNVFFYEKMMEIVLSVMFCVLAVSGFFAGLQKVQINKLEAES